MKVTKLNPKFFFTVGGILVIIGFIVPLLMMAGYIPKWLWLELLTGGLQMVGLILGIIGSVFYFKVNKK